jgi:hypothetical protein
MSLPKINSIINGPTNTGKTLLLSLLLADTKSTRISREKDKSNFHLDHLRNSTAVVFEEPIIDQTIGTWKLLLEGSPIPTDMTHTDKELIQRLPIFISTNHDIWNWVGSEEIPPIQQRVFHYNITAPIQSPIPHPYTVPQPPTIITKHDIYALILHNVQDIFLHPDTITSSYPVSPGAKPFDNSLREALTSLQIDLLLLQDSSEIVRLSDPLGDDRIAS